MFLQTILFRIQNSCIIKFKELEYFESSILIKCTTRLNDYIKNQLFLKRILEIQVKTQTIIIIKAQFTPIVLFLIFKCVQTGTHPFFLSIDFN